MTEGMRVSRKRTKEDTKMSNRNVGKYGVAIARRGDTGDQPGKSSSSEQQSGQSETKRCKKTKMCYLCMYNIQKRKKNTV